MFWRVGVSWTKLYDVGALAPPALFPRLTKLMSVVLLADCDNEVVGW